MPKTYGISLPFGAWLTRRRAWPFTGAPAAGYPTSADIPPRAGGARARLSLPTAGSGECPIQQLSSLYDGVSASLRCEIQTAGSGAAAPPVSSHLYCAKQRSRAAALKIIRPADRNAPESAFRRNAPPPSAFWSTAMFPTKHTTPLDTFENAFPDVVQSRGGNTPAAADGHGNRGGMAGRCKKMISRHT